jgi:GT2 family glycosyltransferase
MAPEPTEHVHVDATGGPVVDGVLVTFDRPRELRHSLRAISGQDLPLRRLWVVDNGRRAADVDGLAEELDLALDVQHVVTGENVGPAGGFALGIERALADAAEADWIVLFDDNDPPASPQLLARLVQTGRELVERGERVGGVGLRGARMRWLRGRTVLPPTRRRVVEVDHLHGGYMPVYRLDALRQAPNFNPALFFGFEELAFGLGLTQRGFHLYVDVALAAEALTQPTSGDTGPRIRTRGSATRRYYSLRNLVWLLRRHGHPIVALRVALVRGLLKPLLGVVLAPRTGLVHARLSARAVRDGFRGTMGRTVELDGSSPDTPPTGGVDR